MSVADNFDYSIGTLNRKNTMYLSVINSQDAVSRPIKKLYTQRDWSTNLYNLDIECSHPRKFGIFSNKVDFINKVDDIERANPKILYYPFKKEEYNLTNRDIEKSYPSAVHFKTKRVTNPLQPKYKFFEGEDYPPEIPRFIRDSIDIKDIPGACPKKRIFTMRRESMNDKLKSIDGAQSHIPYFRKSVGNSKYDYLNYSDVNNFIFKTKRHNHPLDPIYIRKEEDGKSFYIYGPIDKSKPETQYPYYYKPAFNLKVDDIKGCNPGSINYIKKYKGNNYGLDISDIPKTNAGSLKKGITTSRCLNPLMPKYQYLGEKEAKESNMIITTLRKKCGSMPLINDNSLENENEKNKKNEMNKENIENVKVDNNCEKINETDKDNGLNNPKIRIIKNICDIDKSKNSLNKYKINKFNFNITNKEKPKEFKKSNSAMNLLNPKMKLEDINNKNKKIIRFTPLLNSQKSKLINNTNDGFDYTIIRKKPYPFYGYFHDPSLQFRDSIEHLEEIEKSKQDKEIEKKRYEEFIFNRKNNYITEEYKKNPNENNLAFISDNPSLIQNNRIKRKNIDEWYSNNFNDKNGLYRMKNKSFSMRHLGPNKKFYSEKLDSFLNINNIQKNIDERNNYYDDQTQQINPSEYTKRALQE